MIILNHNILIFLLFSDLAGLVLDDERTIISSSTKNIIGFDLVSSGRFLWKERNDLDSWVCVLLHGNVILYFVNKPMLSVYCEYGKKYFSQSGPLCIQNIFS